jgi:hypothetical protein
MSLRRRFGWLPIAAVIAFGWTGCGKDKDDGTEKGAGGTSAASSADLVARCDELAKTCGDKEKHIQTIAAECKEAAREQVASGCTEKAVAAYDCYLKELCGKADKVWALDDLRVLSDRHGKCVAERDASRACVGN